MATHDEGLFEALPEAVQTKPTGLGSRPPAGSVADGWDSWQAFALHCYYQWGIADRQARSWADLEGRWKRECERLTAELADLQRRIEEKGGGPDAPTEWAYVQACKAIERHRQTAQEAREEALRLAEEVALTVACLREEIIVEPGLWLSDNFAGGATAAAMRIRALRQPLPQEEQSHGR